MANYSTLFKEVVVPDNLTSVDVNFRGDRFKCVLIKFNDREKVAEDSINTALVTNTAVKKLQNIPEYNISYELGIAYNPEVLLNFKNNIGENFVCLDNREVIKYEGTN